MRYSVEQDTEALQLQLLKITDYEGVHTVFFQDDTTYEITPDKASKVLTLFEKEKPQVRAAKFRLASLSSDIFQQMFKQAL